VDRLMELVAPEAGSFRRSNRPVTNPGRRKAAPGLFRSVGYIRRPISMTVYIEPKRFSAGLHQEFDYNYGMLRVHAFQEGIFDQD
jgi:hypothetical protein